MTSGNSAEMPNNRCTNCINAAIPCTNSRAKAEEDAHRSSERAKLAQAEVAKIVSPSYEPPADLATCQRLLREIGNYARSLEETLSDQPPELSQRPSESPPPESGVISVTYKTSSPNPELDPYTGFPDTDRSYGNFSSQRFARAAMKHTNEGGKTLIVGIQRPEYWMVPPWENAPEDTTPLFFPEKSLLDALIEIYFDQVNPIWSFLHAPTFRKSMAEGLHYTNRHFAAIVLGICAIASRYSDDPRVLLEGEDQHSAGWKWVRQLQPEKIQVANADYLYQLQGLALIGLHLGCTAQVDHCFLVVGLGIRIGQGLGLHLEDFYTRLPGLEAEMYRRTFWSFLLWEGLIAAIKGRPSITTSIECALDLPSGLDDVDWGKSSQELARSPPGLLVAPSTHAYYRVYFRLLPILERFQHVAHPRNHQRPSEDEIIGFDSALNEWLDEMPEHLKWDPQQQNQIFLDQSATLYVTYYHAQLLIHRSFLPAPGQPAPPKARFGFSTFPSMAICANAARSIGHVLQMQVRRGRGLLFSPYLVSALFDAAVVLLVHVWSVIGTGNRSSTTAVEDFNRASVDVRNCIQLLKIYEKTWRVAGRYCDILTAVLNYGKHSSENARGNSALKRGRPLDAPEPPAPGPEPTQTRDDMSTIPIEEQLEALQQSLQDTEHLFALPLPVRSDELGRLPVYTSWTSQDDSWTTSAPATDYGDLDLDLLSPDLVQMALEEGSNSDTTQSIYQMSTTAPVGYVWEDWAAFLQSGAGTSAGNYGDSGLSGS
ncbi:Fungal-trans domain-containing protein [Mycena chlorophos]|uniref:Fungal-trans domain-containing protein n=1 Tax=Mycena chlorophos TaxID=658473 RepID=A0A8H6W8J1_MYCCL|nr:Fungal-trans domain-containing protein [Mycena chlorophos]